MKAIVFDMDGVLLDTEIICYRLIQKSFQSIGESISKEDFVSMIGLNSRAVKEKLAKLIYQDINLDQFIADWKKKYYLEVVDKGAPVKKGLVDFVKKYKTLNIPMAVATSTDKETAIKKLHASQLLDYFPVVVGGDEVEHGKPHP